MVDQENSTSLDEKTQLPLGEVAEKEPEGAEEKKVEGAEEVKAPVERTYTQAEWDKRQSTIDKLRSKEKEAHDELQNKFIELSAQTEESKIADWLKSVEASGGDMTQANQVADAQRAVSKQMGEVAKQQATISGQLAVINEAEKVTKARKLVTDYALGDGAEEKLLETESPQDMEILALSMQVEKLTSEAKPASKVSSPVAEPKGVDYSKMKSEERLGQILEDIESRQGRK